MKKLLYDDIEDYIKSTGIKVNESFRIGWHMARMKMKSNVENIIDPSDIEYKFDIELTGEYHTDCNLLIKEIERLKLLLSLYK